MSETHKCGLACIARACMRRGVRASPSHGEPECNRDMHDTYSVIIVKLERVIGTLLMRQKKNIYCTEGATT